MIIDWPTAFNRYLDRLEAGVAAGDLRAGLTLDRVIAQLQVLQELDGEPERETAALKQVRQSGRYRVWRLAHPFHPEVAVRLIAWFSPDSPERVVVALFAGDRARMGDVFYDSVASRADEAIDQWKFQRQQEKKS